MKVSVPSALWLGKPSILLVHTHAAKSHASLQHLRIDVLETSSPSKSCRAVLIKFMNQMPSKLWTASRCIYTIQVKYD